MLTRLIPALIALMAWGGTAAAEDAPAAAPATPTVAATPRPAVTSPTPNPCRLEVVEHDRVTLKGESVAYIGEIEKETESEITLFTLSRIRYTFKKSDLADIRRKTTLESAFQNARREAGADSVKHYELGRSCLTCGLETEAVAEFHEALRLDPAYADPYVALADLYRRKKDLDNELGTGLDAVKAVANPAPFHIRNAEILDTIGLPARAETQFQAAIKAAKASSEPYLACAEFHLGHNQLEKAAAMFREALRVRDGLPQALDGLGRIALRQGDVGTAKKFFQRAAVDGKLADPHNGLGAVLMLEGDQVKAEEEFEKALAIDPSFGYAQVNLALVHLGRGDTEKAAPLMEKAAATLPNDFPPLLVAAGVLSEKDQEFAKAAGNYRACLAVDRGNVDAMCGLGRVLLAQDEPEKAVEQFRIALVFDDTSRQALDALIYALMQQNKPAEAAVWVQKLLALAPDDPSVIALVGLIQSRDRYQVPEARAQFEHALQLNGDEPAALVGLAYLCYQSGERDQATKLFQQAARRGYAVKYATATLARIQQSQGESLWSDAFDRGESNDALNGWTENEGAGISIRISQNRLRIEGDRQGDPGRTQLVRSVPTAGFLRVETTLSVPENNAATAALRIRSQRSEILLGVSPTRNLVYAYSTSAAEEPEWIPIKAPPIRPDESIVLKITLVDPRKGGFVLAGSDPEPFLPAPVEVQGLASAQTFEVGLVAVTPTNEHCLIMADSFKIVHKK